jgi:hypothetical protein
VLSADSVGAIAIAGAAPLTQEVQLSAGTAAAVRDLSIDSITVSVGDSTGWVTASLSASAAPAVLTVHLDPRNLPVGRHSAIIGLKANGTRANLAVALSIRPRPVLRVSPPSVAMDVGIGDTLASRTIDLTSSADSIGTLGVSGATCPGSAQPWLTAQLTSSSTPATITLHVDSRSLGVGTHVCEFVVSSAQALVDSASQTVHVAVTVRQAPLIALSDVDLHASAYAASDGPSIRVAITNGGTGTLDGLSVGAIDFGTGPTGWLTASLDSSTAPTSLTLTPTAHGLLPGGYAATIPVTSSAAGVVNSPQRVSVSFVVAPRPFVFVISPSVAHWTIPVNARTFPPPVTVSMFDQNGNSGKIDHVELVSVSIPAPGESGGCWDFFVGVPGQAIPASGLVKVTCTWATPGDRHITERFVLTNGESATFTMIVTVTP